MNCKEFNNNLAELFDKNINSVLAAQMQEHMKNCSDCASKYKEAKAIVAGMQPVIPFTSSGSGLKQKILNQIKKEELKMETVQKEKFRLKTWQKRAMTVAASIVFIVAVFMLSNHNPLVNTAKAAESIMTRSITALESLRSMFITMEVRSDANENFDYISTQSDFIEYKIWKQFTGNEPWRMEKPGRIVLFDGEKQYLYIPEASIAYTASKNAGLVEWMKIFLDPKKIMEYELEFSQQHRAKYATEETSDEIILTVNADALGDFHNNYLKNASVPESDNTRIYTFDKTTSLLKSFKLFVNTEGKSVKVIGIKNIAYNIPILATMFTIQLPNGLAWQELTNQEYVKAFTGISAKKAARKFFKALSDEDYKTITPVWDELRIEDKSKMEQLKSFYGGLEMISIGEPFKSGLYPGEFVPYKVKLRSGKVLESNLAIRNDNPSKTWEVDGGI